MAQNVQRQQYSYEGQAKSGSYTIRQALSPRNDQQFQAQQTQPLKQSAHGQPVYRQVVTGKPAGQQTQPARVYAVNRNENAPGSGEWAATQQYQTTKPTIKDQNTYQPTNGGRVATQQQTQPNTSKVYPAAGYQQQTSENYSQMRASDYLSSQPKRLVPVRAEAPTNPEASTWNLRASHQGTRPSTAMRASEYHSQQPQNNGFERSYQDYSNQNARFPTQVDERSKWQARDAEESFKNLYNQIPRGAYAGNTGTFPGPLNRPLPRGVENSFIPDFQPSSPNVAPGFFRLPAPRPSGYMGPRSPYRAGGSPVRGSPTRGASNMDTYGRVREGGFKKGSFFDKFAIC